MFILEAEDSGGQGKLIATLTGRMLDGSWRRASWANRQEHTAARGVAGVAQIAKKI
jgi:hypothetical protein